MSYLFTGKIYLENDIERTDFIRNLLLVCESIEHPMRNGMIYSFEDMNIDIETFHSIIDFFNDLESSSINNEYYDYCIIYTNTITDEEKIIFGTSNIFTTKTEIKLWN